MKMISMCRRGSVVALMLLGAVLPLTAPAVTAGPARAETRRTSAAGQPATVQAFPSPGTLAAMPATAITFRGLDPGAARSVQVTGSASGAHSVALHAQRDGQGVTLQPRVAFTPGEHVTVRGLAVAGGDGDHFSFTVARPATDHRFEQLDKDGFVAHQSVAAEGTAGTTKAARAAAGPPYRSRPDLVPPVIVPSTPGNGTAPGLLLTTPIFSKGGGAMIMGDTGQPYWYKPVRPDLAVGDLERVRYHGQDALVWFEGFAPYGPGSYRGVWTLVDSKYHKIATIRAANGMQADIHDIDLTSSGKAYIDIYNPVTLDLSAFGGSRTANVLEFVIQEVDIATGDLVFEWHSLNSFPVTDSYEPLTNDPVDYMHGNSVTQDTDSNLLVSARHLSTGFKINRSTGQVMWRLGGKRNQFKFSPAGETGPSYQHHLLRIAPGVLSFFDNGRTRPSRGVQYQVDETALTATRIKEQKHVPPLSAFSQGSYQQLPGGHSLIAWGNTGFVTEYDSAGGIRFQAVLPNSYRSFRSVWHGRPATLPAVAVGQRTDHDTVYVSWNGATDVTSWEVLTGATRTSLAPAATASRDGFETSINVPHARFVEVRGRAADSSVLGTSLVVPVGPWFSEHSAPSVGGNYRPFAGDFTAGAGDDVVFYGPGAASESLWTAAPDGTFTVSPLPPVNGDYTPLVGDFVGDAHDDILWWSQGSTKAFLWRSNGSGGFTSASIGVPASAVAKVLPHRVGKAEVLWYNPGSARDLINGYRWNSGVAPTGVRRSITVNGTYKPVIGDFDGNGWADIVWYGAGSVQDTYWRLSGTPGGASTGQQSSNVRIRGSYTPLVGRFSPTHDTRDDITWYAPGRAGDFVWEGTTGAGFSESSHPNSATGNPILLRGYQDHLYLQTPGHDGTIWVPNGHPDVVRPSRNTAFAAGYQAIAGDFLNTGASGVVWYGAGAAPERLFSPRLG